jgi:hypothetical protein
VESKSLRLRVAIEICCHTTDKDVQEHFERTEETHTRLLQCHEGYVINFTTQSYAPGATSGRLRSQK